MQKMFDNLERLFKWIKPCLETRSGAAHLDADSSPQHPQKARGGLADPALTHYKEAAGDSGHSTRQENSQDSPGWGLASSS